MHEGNTSSANRSDSHVEGSQRSEVCSPKRTTGKLVWSVDKTTFCVLPALWKGHKSIILKNLLGLYNTAPPGLGPRADDALGA